MIGNDIVDLDHARRESNWQRRGFLNKVFSTEEQRLIHSASDPERMVWALWSMKESAYKLIVRQTGHSFFAPRKLACQVVKIQENAIEGSVFYGKAYQTRSILTTHFIASVALPSGFIAPFIHQIVSFAYSDYAFQHEHIRQAVKQFFLNRSVTKESEIQVRKDAAGIPEILLRNSAGQLTTIPVSLSHHGSFGAFAMVSD